MMVTGRQVTSEEALRIGLADEVIAPDHLEARSLELARTVASGATVAQRLIKRAVDEGLNRPLADGLAHERDLFVEVFASEDSRIGVASFLQNGPGKATFTGR